MKGLRRFVPVLIAAVLISCGEGGSCWPEYDSGPPPFDYGPETITYYWFDGSDWTESRREVFSYDGQGRLLRIDHQIDADGVWEDTAGTTYTYDSDGRLLEERFWDPDTGLFSPPAITIVSWYSYDASGRLETENVNVTEGPLRQYVYAYDARGRLVTTSVDFGLDGSIDGEFSYLYDANGRVEEETHGDRVSYSYDAGGRIAERQEDRYRDGAWVPVLRYSYTYDADGRVETMTYSYLPSGGDWTYGLRDTYAYDASGRLETAVKEDYDDDEGAWLAREKREFVFTDEGSSFTFEGAWYPEPFAGWILDYYGQGELNRYLW